MKNTITKERAIKVLQDIRDNYGKYDEAYEAINFGLDVLNQMPKTNENLTRSEK